MAQQTRNTLKNYFNTGDKPTEAQFADLVDSYLNLQDDGGEKVKEMLELLTGLSRLEKKAVRGSDAALNRRGKGDVLSVSYQVPMMVNILRGDYWIYYAGGVGGTENLTEGDWVVALRDSPSGFDFQNSADWEIIHFGDTTVQMQTIDLHHYRTAPTVESTVLVIPGVHAQIVNLTINKLTYYGKYDDGNFGGFDYVYHYAGTDTKIVINEDMIGFRFLTSMVVDVLYKLIIQ